MEKFIYDADTNILYINSNLLMPNMNGMSTNEKIKAVMANNKLSIEDKINRSKYKFQILDEIAKYKDCFISEFSNL